MSRRKAREKAFQQLFQLEINEDVTYDKTSSFMHDIIEGVQKHRNLIDDMIKKYLINWSFERLSHVDRTILRMAIFEMMFLDDIPHAVSINEAVELAHTYGDDQSSKFINGILSNILEKEIKANDR